MMKPVRICSCVMAMVCLVACNPSGDAATSNKSTPAKASSEPNAPAGPTTQGAKVPELVEMKNDKRHFTFKVPKGTKADASGDSYSWDTMQILVEVTLAPVAKADDLMQVVVGSLKDGAKIESKSEGDVLLSIWQQPQGPMHVICGQTGKSVAVRASFEPEHKDIALAICKSLRIDK